MTEDQHDTTEVAATITAYGDAYNLGARPFGMDGVEPFYSKQGLTIVIPGAPDRMFLSWEDYSTAWASALEKFASFHFGTNGDLAVTRIGPVAWASQTGYSHGTTLDGAAFRRALRQTLVLVRTDAWRIVQEHVSLGI